MTKNKWLLALLMLALVIPMRVVGTDKFVTYDEPWWVISGANYYYALAHREPANITYEYHPAITTLWMVTGGMLTYFPEYRGQGQGYFDGRKSNFENYVREQGHETLPIMRNARLFQSAFLVLLALAAFLLIQSLFDEKFAFLSIVTAMCAPFYLGNSRLLNHEAMLSMLGLITFLGMQNYLNKERKLIYLLVSGVAFGLAQLTKSPSIVLIPLMGLMLVVELFKQRNATWGSRIWDAVKIFAIWFAAAFFIYVLLWPAMWVAPGKVLYDVYGNAFSYAFQGGRLEVTQELQPSKFNLANGFTGVLKYLQTWATSSTPLSWLGLIFAAFIFFVKDKTANLIRSTFVYLLILASLFILLFGLVQGRNSPHYIMSSFVTLDVIASIGWVSALLWAQKRWDMLNRAYVLPLAFIVLVAFQLGSSLLYYPYYYTYKNPLTSAGGIHGYGEGLDQAAEYLAQKPHAKDMRVIAYAARGSFSYYFPGQSDLLKFGFSENNQPYIEQIQNADYLVLYPIRQTKPDEMRLLNFLAKVTPERVIYVDGFEYIRIYKISELPKDIYKILARE